MEEITTKKEQIQYKMDIEQAASAAVKVIAEAAAGAAKVVADAAAVSVKVLSIKNADDHDLLIELKTRMESLRTDIKDLKDGTTVQIADHEKRIFGLEKTKAAQTVLITIGTGILSLLVGLMIFHMFNN